MKFTHSLIFSLLFSPIAVSAFEYQDCDVSHRWWLNIGAGAGTSFNHGSANDNFGGAIQLAFNGMITDKLFLTFETTATAGFDDEDATTNDLGILLGYKSKKPNWYWSAAAGIAYYRTEFDAPYTGQYGNYRYTHYYREEEAGAGMPLQAQLFLTPIKHFSLGLIGHGVVSKNPYATAMLAIQIS